MIQDRCLKRGSPLFHRLHAWRDFLVQSSKGRSIDPDAYQKAHHELLTEIHSVKDQLTDRDRAACQRLEEQVRPWPMWSILERTDLEILMDLVLQTETIEQELSQDDRKARPWLRWLGLILLVIVAAGATFALNDTAWEWLNERLFRLRFWLLRTNEMQWLITGGIAAVIVGMYLVAHIKRLGQS